jgi:signal peptidase I
MKEKSKELDSKDKTKETIKNLIPYVVIIIVVVLIRSFIMTPIQVEGTSMYSTLDNNEILILKKYNHNYKRFDVVVFDYNGTKLIKRIIGLPGENIEYKDNKLYVNGVYISEPFLTNNQKTYDFQLKKIGYDTIPSKYYFVLGDNRTNSTDSRIIGLVSQNDIQGTTDFAVFPFAKFGIFNK